MRNTGSGPGHLHLKKGRKMVRPLSTTSPEPPSILSWSKLERHFHSISTSTITFSSDSPKFIAVLVGVINRNLISSTGAHADIFTCSAFCKINVTWVQVGEFRMMPRPKEALCFSEHKRCQFCGCWFLYISPDAEDWVIKTPKMLLGEAILLSW